jgi:hypothetical protein
VSGCATISWNVLWKEDGIKRGTDDASIARPKLEQECPSSMLRGTDGFR